MAVHFGKGREGRDGQMSMCLCKRLSKHSLSLGRIDQGGKNPDQNPRGVYFEREREKGE